MAVPDLPSFKPGHQFPERELSRDQARQDRKLEVCAVDPEMYAGVANVGLFGNECFRHMRSSGQDIDGYVHMEQRYRQFSQVMIGEPITLSGRTEAVEDAPRGLRLHQVFDFRRASGEIAVTADVIGLIPDPEKMTGPSKKSDGETFNPMQFCICLDQKYMQPEQVKEFSGDVGNLIHTDPVFAKSIGYRAPIAQGLMTAVWMMETMADFAPPQSFDVSFRFLRPVFWDDEMALWAKPTIELYYDTVFCVNGDGKATAEMKVAELVQ